MEYYYRFLIVCVLAGICQFSQIYGFEKPCDMSTKTAEVVDHCPTDEDDYKEAASRKNCSSINNTCESFVYHCVVNGWGNATIEVCAPWLFIVGRVCGEYSYYFESIRSTARSCDNFTMPCPYKYNSTEQYKVPECYYIADKANTSASIPTTEMSQTTVYSKSTPASTESTSQTMPPIKNVPPEKNEGLSEGVIIGIVIAVLVVVVLICLLVMFFVYVRRKMKNEQKSCKQVITTLPFCSQCCYEASFMLKMQKFMDKRYRQVDARQSTSMITPDATSSVPLISNNKNDEQITENDDECDVSLQMNIQQQDACFPQNQPDVSSPLTATTAQQVESKSLHSSNESLIPPTTSLAQKFNTSTSSLDVTLQPDQLLEADSFVSSNTQDKPLNSPPGQQLHPSNSQTEQSSPSSTPDSVSPDEHPNSPPNPVTHQNSPSFSASDQPKNTSSIALQSEPLDLSISSAEAQNLPSFCLDKASSYVDLSINSTSVSVPTNQSENLPLQSPSYLRNSSVPKHPEVNPVTFYPSTPVTSSPSIPVNLFPSNPVTSSHPVSSSALNSVTSSPSNPITSSPASSAFFGRGDSETTQKKCVQTVQPESPEAPSELAVAGPSRPQQNVNPIKLGKRLTAETPRKTPKRKLSTTKGAEGGVFNDRMHKDNTDSKAFGNADKTCDVDEMPMELNEVTLENISGITPIPHSDGVKEDSTRKEVLEDKLDTVLNKLEKMHASMSQLQLSFKNAESDLNSIKDDIQAAIKKLHDVEKKFETTAEELRQIRDQLQDQHQRNMCEKDREKEESRDEVCEKDRLSCEKNRKLKEQQQDLLDKDRIINDKDRIINDKDRIINEKQKQSIEKEAEFAERERELGRELRRRGEEIREQRERIRQLEDRQNEQAKIVKSLKEELKRKESNAESDESDEH